MNTIKRPSTQTTEFLRYVIVTGLALLIMTACGSPGGNPNAKQEPAPFKGRVAPDFTLKAMDGSSVALSDYRGKKVMLNFWATWCPPCRAEMPGFQRLHEEYEEEVVFLGVNATSSDDPQNVVDFVAESGITFPILLDIKEGVQSKYGVRALPTTFFIDSSGNIHEIMVGPASESFLKKKIQEMP